MIRQISDKQPKKPEPIYYIWHPDNEDAMKKLAEKFGWEFGYMNGVLFFDDKTNKR